MLERLEQHADDLIATLGALVTDHGPEIAGAAQVLVDALVHERRIFCCGNGGSGANAQSFVSKLINRFEHERPALPAIALGGDSTSLGALSADGQLGDVFARPLQGLAHAGDVLVVLTVSASTSNIVQAIRTAQERDCRVIALTGLEDGEIVRMLSPRDVLLRLPARSIARQHEVQLFVLHCFCDLIDQALFGAHDV
jgi:D-sedoheptulose 7-phosphate isomerase